MYKLPICHINLAIHVYTFSHTSAPRRGGGGIITEREAVRFDARIAIHVYIYCFVIHDSYT